MNIDIALRNLQEAYTWMTDGMVKANPNLTPEEIADLRKKEAQLQARKDRYWKVVLLRQNGEKFSEIGKKIGVGPSRAQSIYQRACWMASRNQI